MEKFAGNLDRYKRVLYKISGTIWKLARFCIIFGLCFVLLYPLLYTMSMAFRPYEQILDPSVVWIPRSLTFDNITKAMDFMNYGVSLLNTVLISVVSSVLLVASCSLVGYGFARFRFKGRNIFFGLVLFTIVVPPQTTLIPLFLGFSDFDFFYAGQIPKLFGGKAVTANLINSLWTMYLPAIFASGLRSGLFIYIFRQFYSGLPRELEDAAAVDGCGPMHTFLKVMVPLSSASFITVFLFSYVWYWNDYYYSSMFFLNGNTVSLALSSLSSKLIADFGTYDPYRFIVNMQAGSLLLIFPPLLIYILFQRYFTESIEKTGIIG